MVKQGYKQTEVGTIPVDWQVSTMESITSLMTNGFVGTIKSEYVPSGTGVLYLQGFNIKENGFDLTGVTYVSDSFHKKHLKSELKENDLLTVQTGDVGVTSCLPKRFEGANCQALIISRFYDKYDSRFWSYYFNSIGRKTLKLIETGTTMKHINVGDMKGVLVPVPKTKDEQKRIAETLSDVDSMISTLEKLIAKKKAVKQGAMQELLTGKKRLPGFSGEWQESTLGALCYLITKQTGFDYTNEIKPSLVDINSSNTLPFVQNKDFEGKNVNVKTDYYIPYDIAIKYPRILLDETCLLISLSGRIGNVGLYEKSNGLAFIGGAVGICRFKDEQNSEWCMLYLQSSAGQKQIFECQKSGAQHNLTVEDVRKLVIKLPSSLEEQTAIASILSDMDNEIEALEQKLEKARQIKQGMMQQLLTGKIRLV